MKIAIIGGGAAGFFAAIAAKENFSAAHVVIFEQSKNVLAKVKISGGGRCNLTHQCESVSELCLAYPRGGKLLKKAFHIFNNTHCVSWFESRGVPLMVQDDNCVFPVSQNSRSIIDCFIKESKRLGIEIKTSYGIKEIECAKAQLKLIFTENSFHPQIFDKVIITTGGLSKSSNLNWLKSLGHTIEKPIPSLFPFNIPNDSITDLTGIVVNHVVLGIKGHKIKADGALLITHWGMSGPAILKLSSYAARQLDELNYNFILQLNWICETNYEKVTESIIRTTKDHPNKLIANHTPFNLPSRLWEYLLEKCGMNPQKKWCEIGKKEINKLCNTLINDEYTVKGRSKYVEEIVCCGGVSLDSIFLHSLQSKHVKNLYFAGEVLDIDGITGGFNLQNAWTTGFIAGKLLD